MSWDGRNLAAPPLTLVPPGPWRHLSSLPPPQKQHQHMLPPGSTGYVDTPPAEPVCQSAAEQAGSQSQPASLGSRGAQSTASDVEEALKTYALPLLPVIRQGCEALKQSLRGRAVGSVSLPVCFPFHFLIFC